MSVDLEDLHIGDGFYDVIGDSVPRWVGVVGIDIFIECLWMLEVFFRSYCYRSIFKICMVHLLSSWCVEMVRSWGLMRVLFIFMVCGDGSLWCIEIVFFMVCGDGFILRTNGILGKGVVYAFIWHVILGVMMVSFLCHGILLILV